MASFQFSTPEGVSKKLVVLILTTVLIALNNKMGLGMLPEQIDNLIMLASAYLVGQGVADLGKGKAQLETKTANKEKQP